MPEIPFRKIIAFIKGVLPKSFWVNMPISIKQLVYLFEAVFATLYFRFLGRKLKVIGVTGTDGKTTTSYFIYSILRAAGKKVASISTVGAKIGDKDIDTGFHVTTPDSWLLQKFIKSVADKGNEYLVLEVTSHALDQNRVFGIPFEVGVLTNITHEHLDYHQTFEKYLEAKAKLFQSAKISILNKDDPSFERLRKISPKFLAYSRQVLNLEGLSTNLQGLSESELKEHGIRMKLLGDYNWSNALAAALTARSLNISWEDIKTGIEAVDFIPGRMEEIVNDRGFRIFVDFAHTPNGLEKSLSTARQIAGKGRVIVVFGCAGERDRTKRPIMGEIAGKLADIAILTAEDPRTEDVNEIIDQIAQGSIRDDAIENYIPIVLENMTKVHDGVCNFLLGSCESEKENYSGNLEELKNSANRIFIRIPDRKKAIELALQVAKLDDCVIITGKGHEKSMCYGLTEYPWSDREVVKELLLKE